MDITREYAFGQKNNWRRRVWNRVRQQAGRDGFPSVEEMRVLFLSGASCEDLPVAVAKGFRKRNLLAVDADQAACRFARKQGIMAVRGDLSAVLLSLGEEDAFDVIIADFCTNFSAMMHRFVWAVILTRARRSPLYVITNTLRGREHGPYREALKTSTLRHRGDACTYLFYFALKNAARQFNLSSGDWQMGPEWLDSYRSGTQIMDSAGIVVCLPPSEATHDWPEPELLDARRSIAAARAVHTMQAS